MSRYGRYGRKADLGAAMRRGDPGQNDTARSERLAPVELEGMGEGLLQLGGLGVCRRQMSALPVQGTSRRGGSCRVTAGESPHFCLR